VIGRPSSYKPEFADHAQKLCKLGAIDRELAEFFGVSEKTINSWKQEHAEFLQSIKEGKLFADANVASRLYQRAMGYEHPEVHVSNYQGEITLTPLIKHYAPDSTAAIFWLKNRRPEQWRDKTEQQITVKHAATELTDDELQRIAATSSAGASEATSSPQVPPSVH
jgi:cell fate (sporulation/competence/biofilm development) regulator YmcA (YheA/YmcA/DUF963 family)